MPHTLTVPHVNLCSLGSLQDRWFDTLEQEAFLLLSVLDGRPRETIFSPDHLRLIKKELSFLIPPVPIENVSSTPEESHVRNTLEHQARNIFGFLIWVGLETRDTHSLETTLSTTVSHLTSGKITGFRRSGIRTTSGGGNLVIDFGSFDEAFRRWIYYKECIMDICLKSKTKAALAAFVCITNCHLFNDGNGRLARVTLISGLAGGKLHLPMRKMEDLLGGAVLHYVRRVEWADRWEELVISLCLVLRTIRNTLC